MAATGTTAYSYDDVYRLTSVSFPGSRTVSYGYDDASRRTTMTYPGGTDQVAYGYDAANRLTSVTDWNSDETTYAYDNANRLTTVTLPSAVDTVSTYTYDNADRLTGIDHVQGGTTTVAYVDYTLDAVGNRTQRVDDEGTHSYSYDDLYRLTQVTYPGPSTTSYAYDAFGNRTSKTVGTDTTSYSYDDADRLTTVTPPSPASAISYTWDDNGNLTDRGTDEFAWDYEDRLTSATVDSATTTFAYRGDGLRDSRTFNSNTTTFTWDIAAGLPVVIDDEGARYVYGVGLLSQVTSSETYYYLADGLGSTMATVDSSGNVANTYTYDVFGETRSSTGSQANEFQFAGQQVDGSTGLQYLRARYLDMETGRFISREPMAIAAGASLSQFAYVAGNPVTLTDATGLFPGCGWCSDAAKKGKDVLSGTVRTGETIITGGAEVIANGAHFGMDAALDWVSDPVNMYGVGQAASALAAALACTAAAASAGGLLPACVAAVYLYAGATIAKWDLIEQKAEDGEWNAARTLCTAAAEAAPVELAWPLKAGMKQLCRAAGSLASGDHNDPGQDEKP